MIQILAVLIILICCGSTAPEAASLRANAHSSKYKLLSLGDRFVKWGKPLLGTGAIVRFHLLAQRHAYPSARNCQAMKPISRVSQSSNVGMHIIRDELRAAFDAWQAVANIEFVEVRYADQADIVIGAQADPLGRAFADVAPGPVPSARTARVVADADHETLLVRSSASSASGPAIGAIERSLICLNPEQRWKAGFNGDRRVYDLRFTFMHEIGHAIGLDHPGSRNEVMGFKYSETFRSLQAGDIAGARRLYGPQRRTLADQSFKH